MKADVGKVIRNILKDIQVDLKDEFDQNFEREAFFSEAWQRRRSPIRPDRNILVDSGTLRRSITSRTTEKSVVFSSSLPYSGIHNNGGEIVVTAKMKHFFWGKYREASGTFERKKDGSLRKTKKNACLESEADFWKVLALMHVGKAIRIPRRRFLGAAPEVERIVREIIEENLREYFGSADFRNNFDFKIKNT
ncbi:MULTISPECIES: phage virion morphogenesis protein [Prevotellaceae]|uniref:phage virion morphogenesis protein n=1 Tax=Prevotellaceae TaxID=171552 RepID=UPI0003D39E7D|nr:phage virion morphogenesis protein [Prevotella phocaeensis]ETD21433.1 hypothetical protein HMPREF1199_00507 [Hoylesella oralis CC98A]